MSDNVHSALLAHGQLEACQQRPAYQKNDYIGWTTRPKQRRTQDKRLRHMLDGLAAGDRYMQMTYPAKKDAG